MKEIADYISGAILVVVATLGGIPLIGVLLLMMFVDFVTGFLVGIKNKNISSEKLRDGMFKKLGELILVGILAIFCIAIVDFKDVNDTIASFESVISSAPKFVLGIFIIGEFVSIIENTGNMGVRIPSRIGEILEKINTDN